MKDILFDEKIAGSIHLTPGQAYKEAQNGNESQIHWDLILRMDPEAGGGEILVRRQAHPPGRPVRPRRAAGFEPRSVGSLIAQQLILENRLTCQGHIEAPHSKRSDYQHSDPSAVRIPDR